MFAVFKKELKSYFLSPIGYIAIGLFLLVFSVFFYITTIEVFALDLGSLYYATAMYGLLFVVPLITMRMFAEERKNGTEQLLLTSPRSITGIVLGKFLAAVALIAITLVISLIYFVILTFFGDPNIVTTLVAMVGFLLVAMAAISFGIFTSSLTENQIVSAIITVVFLILPWFLPNISTIFSEISLIDKFAKMSSGLISITEIVGLLSFTVMFILFTIIVMQRRKALK